MLAEDLFQNLQDGINLLNLLMFYAAPPSPALIEMLDRMLEEDRLQLALDDLARFESQLLALPERPGPELKSADFAELAGGPLQALLRRLALLNALYEGKNGNGSTQEVQALLKAEPFADLHSLQLAVASLHQLKDRR